MTQILISSPLPPRDALATSSKSSTTTSVVALTPSTDDASVISDGSIDTDVPVQSVRSVSQAPSLASLDSFNQSFTWHSPSPVLPSVANEGDVPVPSIEAVPLAGLFASHESFNGCFAWRSPNPGTPAISLSPPPSTAASSRPVHTPRSHSRSGSIRSTAIDGDMSALRLSESSASNADTSSSGQGPGTPRTASVERSSTRSSELSSPGQATPTTTATDSTVPRSANGDMASGTFSLVAMQAALDQDVSRHPVTPRANSDRQHLSPTPTARDSSQRRRRSSSAIVQPRHEVSDEEPPENRFHQPEFQQAFQEAKQLMADLADVLRSSRLHNEPDSTMKKLYKKAKQLRDFTCPDTRTVGFVGDSGVGKSSLINSLLDIEHLARTSSGGEACTCVVTEYCYRPEPGFEIQVEYFSREELEKQISELLESYRHYNISFDDLEDDEIAVFEKRAQVAEDTFRAMFRVQLQDMESVLLDEDEDEEDVLCKLMSWVDNSPHSITANESLADPESCSQRLMELTSDLASGDEASLWPFIRKIRVFCNAHILSKGLILVDLPGLRDINSARRGITERYILNCDEIFAVCNIIRAITDEGVMAVIDLANKASLSNVGIICTRSDDIQAEEAKKDWKGERARTVRAIQNLVTAARQNVRKIEEEVKEYDDMDPDELVEWEKDEYIRLRRRVGEAKKVVVQREFELKSFLINTRNEIVRQQLREAYKDRIPGGDLSVFCVSNTDYWKERPLPKDVSIDLLELSGMIEVRKHCISIVGESQHRAATLYMKRKIPALLDSLQLWVQSGSGSLSAERKKAIRQTLDNVERIMRRGLTDANSELNKTMIKGHFLSFVAHYQHKDIWAQGAANAADEWSGWHLSSYAAFCRNFGDYSTRAAGTHNWNEEAIESMVFTLSPKWRELCAQIESQRSHATGILEELCEEAIKTLESEDQLDDDQVDVLANSIRTHQNLLESKLEDSYEEVKKDLARLKTDVLTGIQTSFIGQAMNPSYRACNRESGTGSDSRRKTIINWRLRGEDIFDEMEMQLRAQFRDMAAEFKSKQVQATRTHFGVIKENLDMLRDDHVIEEAESDPEFRMKVDEEVRRVKARLDRLIACL